MNPRISVVIGRGYGDEGKGLVVDYLAAGSFNTLVIRHNGGAQSGHTVEVDGESEVRFVFHELSSGSMRHADTFWASTYLPDLFKLSEELSDFKTLMGFEPVVYADVNTNITLIYDVFINMLLETSRGSSRHGSCGMGINEADLRVKAGFGLTISEVSKLSYEELVIRIEYIIANYIPLRLKELNLEDEFTGEYKDLISDRNVLINYVKTIKENVCKVNLVNDFGAFISKYEHVIFESGQGLLLDSECEASLPHVTASRTGLTNPVMLLSETGFTISEVFYVTRSYVTKHGAGSFYGECDSSAIGSITKDMTNVDNDWQGSIRYGKYESIDSLLAPVIRDINILKSDARINLVITHLNETQGKVAFVDSDMRASDFCSNAKVRALFSKVYKSYSHFSKDITSD